jgi:hypothetical protein
MFENSHSGLPMATLNHTLAYQLGLDTCHLYMKNPIGVCKCVLYTWNEDCNTFGERWYRMKNPYITVGSNWCCP